MKMRLLVSLLLLGPIAFAQIGKRTKVQGTKCSLIPPPGFVVAPTFSGFQNTENGASIMVNELEAPYQSLADGFTAEALKTKGMTLINKETIDFNHSKATLIHVTQPANGNIYMKQMFIFGFETGAVLVNGTYPEASKEIEGIVKEALLTTIYDASQKDNPLEAATFTIDIKDTDFKLIKYMSGSLIYSTDGKLPTEKPTLIVGNSISKFSSEDLKKYSEDRLRKLPGGEQSVFNEVNEIQIDGLKGYEIVANGKSKEGKPQLIYQVMLYNSTSDYYIVVGQANEEFDKNLLIYRRVAKTFKRK